MHRVWSALQKMTTDRFNPTWLMDQSIRDGHYNDPITPNISQLNLRITKIPNDSWHSVNRMSLLTCATTKNESAKLYMRRTAAGIGTLINIEDKYNYVMILSAVRFISGDSLHYSREATRSLLCWWLVLVILNDLPSFPKLHPGCPHGHSLLLYSPIYPEHSNLPACHPSFPLILKPPPVIDHLPMQLCWSHSWTSIQNLIYSWRYVRITWEYMLVKRGEVGP